MRELSKLQSMVMLAGGSLMVAGAGMYVFGLAWASWLFLAGALLFAAMQWQQRYEGSNFVLRRLRRMMLIADVLFVVSGMLMVECAYAVVRPWFYEHVRNGSMAYITYIYNKWVVTLLIAAILEVYTTHRISNELDKEAKKR